MDDKRTSFEHLHDLPRYQGDPDVCALTLITIIAALATVCALAIAFL